MQWILVSLWQIDKFLLMLSVYRVQWHSEEEFLGQSPSPTLHSPWQKKKRSQAFIRAKLSPDVLDPFMSNGSQEVKTCFILLVNVNVLIDLNQPV